LIVFSELRNDQLIETRQQKAEFNEKSVYRREIYKILGWNQTIFWWAKPTPAHLWLRH
jgi:hypothetical protein